MDEYVQRRTIDEYVQYLEMKERRSWLYRVLLKMNQFVNEKGILELLDTKYESYSLDFGEKMIAYRNWLADAALPTRRELKVAMKMRSDFENGYCKDHYYRFKTKYTIWNHGDNAKEFTDNWVNIFTALDTYIDMLQTKQSWGIYFRKVLPKLWNMREHVQDTQHVQQLLLQLKQCIEEPSNIDSRYESYSRI
jgi:hypothetical protein